MIQHVPFSLRRIRIGSLTMPLRYAQQNQFGSCDRMTVARQLKMKSRGKIRHFPMPRSKRKRMRMRNTLMTQTRKLMIKSTTHRPKTKSVRPRAQRQLMRPKITNRATRMLRFASKTFQFTFEEDNKSKDSNNSCLEL